MAGYGGGMTQAGERDRPVVVDRAWTARGELVLRRAGDHHEIIHNGVFLMDTRAGASERLLVSAALQACGAAAASVVIGGLGVGFSLVEALADARVRAVTVVEVEPAVIGWHRPGGPLATWSRGALADPRTRVVRADVAAWLARDRGVYDAVCLDVDNGPEWTVTRANQELYGDAGLDALARRLTPTGALTVWSAMHAPRFQERLHRRFASVEVREVPSATRGGPDVVYVAAGPRR